MVCNPRSLVLTCSEPTHNRPSIPIGDEEIDLRDQQKTAPIDHASSPVLKSAILIATATDSTTDPPSKSSVPVGLAVQSSSTNHGSSTSNEIAPTPKSSVLVGTAPESSTVAPTPQPAVPINPIPHPARSIDPASTIGPTSQSQPVDANKRTGTPPLTRFKRLKLGSDNKERDKVIDQSDTGSDGGSTELKNPLDNYDHMLPTAIVGNEYEQLSSESQSVVNPGM